MPGNLISVNDSKDLTWYVGDSKIEKLIEFLDKVGFKRQPEDKSPDPSYPDDGLTKK